MDRGPDRTGVRLGDPCVAEQQRHFEGVSLRRRQLGENLLGNSFEKSRQRGERQMAFRVDWSGRQDAVEARLRDAPAQESCLADARFPLEDERGRKIASGEKVADGGELLVPADDGDATLAHTSLICIPRWNNKDRFRL